MREKENNILVRLWHLKHIIAVATQPGVFVIYCIWSYDKKIFVSFKIYFQDDNDFRFYIKIDDFKIWHIRCVKLFWEYLSVATRVIKNVFFGLVEIEGIDLSVLSMAKVY